MAVFNGFAPSFFQGKSNQGRLIYISPGSVNGIVLWNGGSFGVPDNATTTVYANTSGQILTGTVPSGLFGIAVVIVSGNVIQSITDIRTGSATGSNLPIVEVVTASGTTFGPLQHTPNGQYFQLFKNGQLLTSLGSSPDYTLSGASGTLTQAATAGDLFIAVYTF